MHVAAIFWAIHWGYGLPIASIPEPAKDQVEKVRDLGMPARFTRQSQLIWPPEGTLCKPILLRPRSWSFQGFNCPLRGTSDPLQAASPNGKHHRDGVWRVDDSLNSRHRLAWQSHSPLGRVRWFGGNGRPYPCSSVVESINSDRVP